VKGHYKSRILELEKNLTTTGIFGFVNNSIAMTSLSLPGKLITTSSENSKKYILPHFLANSCLWDTAEPRRAHPTWKLYI
jgi:hypothetical protein